MDQNVHYQTHSVWPQYEKGLKNVHKFTVQTKIADSDIDKLVKQLREFLNKFQFIADIEIIAKTYEKYTQQQLIDFNSMFSGINFKMEVYELSQEGINLINQQHVFQDKINNVSSQKYLELIWEKVLPQFIDEAEQKGITFRKVHQDNAIQFRSNGEVKREVKQTFFNQVSKYFDQCCILQYTSSSEKERDIKYNYLISSKNFLQYSRECFQEDQKSTFSFFVLLYNIKQSQIQELQDQLDQFLNTLQFQSINKTTQLPQKFNKVELIEIIKEYESRLKQLTIEFQIGQQNNINIELFFKLYYNNNIKQTELDKFNQVCKNLVERLQQQDQNVQQKNIVSQQLFNQTNLQFPFLVKNPRTGSAKIYNVVISNQYAFDFKLIENSEILNYIIANYKQEFNLNFELKSFEIYVNEQAQQSIILHIKSLLAFQKKNLEQYLKQQFEQLQLRKERVQQKLISIIQNEDLCKKKMIIIQVTSIKDQFKFFGFKYDLENLFRMIHEMEKING